MGLGALSTAIEGLNAAQQQINVISQNIANASTPGYTTKTVALNSLVLGGSGAGVSVGQIQRTMDTTLQNNLLQQTSVSNSSDTAESYLNQLQQLLGTPDSNTSISGSLSTLKSDFIALDADPSNGILQTQVVNDAQNVTSQFNTMSSSVQGMRNNAQNDISSDVSQVNQLLQNIASANLQIVKANNSNQNTADLADTRDQYIQQLSQFMNVATYSNGDGSITVQTISGGLLADTTAQTLSFSPTPQTASTYYPASANGIMLNGSDVSGQITSGSVGQLLNLRDNTLPQVQAMLDENAHKLALRFHAQGVNLFTDASGNVPTNTVANYVGFSGTVQVNPAVIANTADLQNGTGGATLNSGDNTNITNILNYAFGANSDAAGTPNTPFNTTGLGANANISINMPSGGDILGYTSDLVSTLAQQYSQANSDKTYQDGYYQTLQKQFQDETGVSIDAQLSSLITVQNAYSANARIITTVSQLFSDLLQTIQ